MANDVAECPCQKKLRKTNLIGCTQCEMWWHVDCVGLTGLSQPAIRSLSKWLCPLCLPLPANLTRETNNGQCTCELATVVAKQVTESIPKIEKAVTKAVTNAVSKNDEVQKNTWAGFFKTKQEETKKLETWLLETK